MRLKNRKGLTAMVDAMIFIVVMGLAVSAMFAFSGGDHSESDASSVIDGIFSAKLRACDITDTDDSRLISMPDMIAFCLLTNDKGVMEYLESVLDILMQRPGSYRLDIVYLDKTASAGSGRGDPVSGSVKEFTVTYGGTVKADLKIY